MVSGLRRQGGCRHCWLEILLGKSEQGGWGLEAFVEGRPVELGGDGEGEAGDVVACDLDSLPLALVERPYEGAVTGEEGGGRAGGVAGTVVTVDADNDVRLCGCGVEKGLFYRQSLEGECIV